MELLMLLELITPERYHGASDDSMATATPAPSATAAAGDAAASAAPQVDFPGSCSTDVAALRAEAAETAAATAAADVSAGFGVVVLQ
jgi:hypothetical protein